LLICSGLFWFLPIAFNELKIAQCLPEIFVLIFLLSVAAPQRTSEDTETDQSLFDGNSSSDDPLNSTKKR
jgi:hypothetical protein